MPIVAELEGPIGRFSKYLMSIYINMALARKQKVLPIMIDSPGGSPYAMRSIIDMLKASNLEVVTICTGMAASAATPLFAMGKKGGRFAYPSARFLVHETRKMNFSVAPGIEKGSDIVAEGKEMDLLTDDMYKVLDSQAGKKSGYFKNLVYSIGNADLIMSSEEAKSHGLVSEIKVPSLKEIFGSDPNTQVSSNDSDFDLLMSVKEDNKTFIAEKKKEFELLYKDEFSLSQDEFSNLSEDYLLSKNNILLQKEENESPMPKTIGLVDGDGTDNGKTQEPVFSQSAVEEMINRALSSQTTAFEQKLNENFLKAKNEARQEVEGEFKQTIESLQTQMSNVVAQSAVTKQEKELSDMRYSLKKLHETDNKITFVEMAKHEEFMLKFTKVEDGSRDMYLKNLEARPVNSRMRMNKEATFNDSTALNGKLSEQQEKMLNSDADKDQINLVGLMDKYLADNNLKRDTVNLRKARRYALEQHPNLAAQGIRF